MSDMIINEEQLKTIFKTAIAILNDLGAALLNSLKIRGCRVDKASAYPPKPF